ncbi:iron-containing alcohol dehydrogenase [Desulfobacterales bacterium HSG16]|nr:iron-containing alcohol dehydrogenase [Desulfobacterales bacterium HSG16]
MLLLPSYYEFHNPVRIISGKKALDNLPSELESLGAKRPLVITDKGVSNAGLIKFIIDAFKESEMTIAAIFDEVPPDSSIKVVNTLAGIFTANRCDSIVAVGGGSVIDTAKGVNIVVTEKSDDLMKFIGAEMLKKPMKPLIVIPTTSGTGSEVTCVAVISDTDRDVKMAFSSNHLMPKVAVLDPRMTLTLPPHITAATAMDAMTHAVESYIGLQKNPFSDIHAMAAIRMIAENIITVVKDGKNEQARLAMANASCAAGAAFSNSMVGVVHSMGHALGGVCHIPHGVAMSIFLPYGLEYNMHKVGDAIGEILLPLAGSEIYAATPVAERPEKTVAVIRELRDELYNQAKLPRTLKEANVSPDKFEKIAQMAINDGSAIFNPEELEYEDAIGVLKKAYE